MNIQSLRNTHSIKIDKAKCNELSNQDGLYQIISNCRVRPLHGPFLEDSLHVVNFFISAAEISAIIKDKTN
jgi:hypothetical protein